MLAVIWPLITAMFSFIRWRSEKKHLSPEHVVLSSEGIDFRGRDANGRVPWTRINITAKAGGLFSSGNREARFG